MQAAEASLHHAKDQLKEVEEQLEIYEARSADATIDDLRNELDAAERTLKATEDLVRQMETIRVHYRNELDEGKLLATRLRTEREDAMD